MRALDSPLAAFSTEAGAREAHATRCALPRAAERPSATARAPVMPDTGTRGAMLRRGIGPGGDDQA